MKRRHLIILGIILLMTIPLALLLADVTREVIAIELMRILWIGNLFFQNLAQAPLWISLLLFVLIIGARSLLGFPEPKQERTPVETDIPGKVQELQRWIERSMEGEYFRSILAKRLANIALDPLAEQERVTPVQMRERIREGRLDAPPEVRDYFQAGLQPTFSEPTGFLARIRERSVSGASSADPHNQSLEQVIQFLEDLLET